MHDASDMELLRDYHQHGAEAAFAELVKRHVNLVYSVALRHVVIGTHAEEITQAVFVILARKAASLRADTILEGWLHETTRLTALSFLRGERRRQFREQEAYMQSTLQKSTTEDAWHQLAPLLDEALTKLGTKDRDAVMLRFFKEQSVREVAVALNMNESAAQRRILRAVDKLRKFFTKRGIVFPAAVLTVAISANSVQAAPAVLVKTTTTVALAKGATASSATLTLIKGALKLMAWTQAKTAIAVGVGVLLAAGTTTVTIQEVQKRRMYPWQVANVSTAFLQRMPPQFQIVRTKFPMQPGSWAAINWGRSDGRILGISMSADGILEAIYDKTSTRTILPPGLPTDKYDFIANLPAGNVDALRDIVKRRLGFTGKLEARKTDVLRLRVKTSNAPGLKPGGSRSAVPGLSLYTCSDLPLSHLANYIEGCLQIPVIDETGLTRKFDIDLEMNGDGSKLEVWRQPLLDQLGLELVPGYERIEMLVVEKAN